MLESKLIEVRDIATRIDILVVRLISSDRIESRILHRNGYSEDNALVQVTNLDSGESYYDSFDWGTSTRTMHTAHRYIQHNWDSIPNYWTVDVETILGEKSEMKIPERFNSYETIPFRIKESIIGTDFMEVVNILRDFYNLKSAKYEGSELISINKDEISKLGVKFYEVLNQYLDVIK